MVMKRISAAGLALLIACAALPASQAPETLAAVETTAQKQSGKAAYIKPGAAIDLSYDYDGLINIGQAETITLSISHMYSRGYLRVTLMPDYGLTIISGESTVPHSLRGGEPITLPVQLTAKAAGTYSLGVEIVYESEQGYQSRRVVSVPLVVGASTLGKAQQKAPVTSFKSENRKPGSTDVIGMAARETIRQ